MKKIIAKDNRIENTKSGSTNIDARKPKKHEENLKILCKAKWNCRT